MRYFLIPITFLLLSCTHQKQVLETNGTQYIKAKLIRQSCASTVIQILDKNYFSLGENWTEMGTNKVVENAVAVANKCDMPETIKVNDEFYFKVVPKESTSQECIVCMMMDYPPNKSIYIKVK